MISGRFCERELSKLIRHFNINRLELSEYKRLENPLEEEKVDSWFGRVAEVEVSGISNNMNHLV